MRERVRHAVHAEFRSRDLAQRNGARAPQPRDEHRIALLGRIVHVKQRAVASRHAGAGLADVLDAERHACKQARVVARRDPAVDLAGLPPGAVGVQEDEAVEAPVLALDFAQAVVHDRDCLEPRRFLLPGQSR